MFQILYMGPNHITATQIVLQFHSVPYCGTVFSDPKLLAGSGKITPDPDLGCSGSEMNLKKNYSEKLIKKFDNFSTKMLNLKMQIPFFQKNP
jgi:hypothetical protein